MMGGMDRFPAEVPDEELGLLLADEISDLVAASPGGNGQKSFFTLQIDLDIASVKVVFL
jgi:hypothetical protein